MKKLILTKVILISCRVRRVLGFSCYCKQKPIITWASQWHINVAKSQMLMTKTARSKAVLKHAESCLISAELILQRFLIHRQSIEELEQVYKLNSDLGKILCPRTNGPFLRERVHSFCQILKGDYDLKEIRNYYSVIFRLYVYLLIRIKDI